MDKNGLPWEENDYVKLNICVQINGLKMQQFWTDSLDDPVPYLVHTGLYHGDLETYGGWVGGGGGRQPNLV